MTENQATKKVEVEDRHICEICNELIEPQDLATYAMPCGPDDYYAEPAHRWCVDQLEEQMYRLGEEGDCL
ncbi:MAG: hypothetical protein U9O94_07230 [Nanoarchaeota archaeon]|nr:hypothetical protein [Nanoarchaeota archaeon]